MSHTPQSKKICAYCGEDCANQPRIKDEHGRYFHKGCFELAKQEYRERKAAEAAPAQEPQDDDEPLPYDLSDTGGGMKLPRQPAPAAVDEAEDDEVDPYGLSDTTGGMKPPKSAASTTPQTEFATYEMDEAGARMRAEEEAEQVPGKPCPECGHHVPEGALICAGCGLNFATGKRMPTTYSDLAKARMGELGGGKHWPTILGALSILVGVGQLGAGATLAITSATGGHVTGAYDIAHLSGATIGALLGLWLTLAGTGIIRRRQMASVWMHHWAIAQIVLCLAAVAAFFAGLSLVGSVADAFDERFGTALATEGVQPLIAPAAIVAASLLIGPVFWLIWLARQRVQKQVGGW